MSFIPSSRDGGVSEEATGDGRNEVVEAKTGQAAAPLSTGSCSCEPSLSAPRRLKTRCRSSMGSNRLNGLALAYVDSEIPVDPNLYSDGMLVGRGESRCNLTGFMSLRD